MGGAGCIETFHQQHYLHYKLRTTTVGKMNSLQTTFQLCALSFDFCYASTPCPFQPLVLFYFGRATQADLVHLYKP